MDQSRRSFARAGSALFAVAVAALAAAAAHVAIDALGDIVLAHDTYDDVVHRSYTVAAATASAALLAAAARSVYDALAAALGRRAARLAFRIVAPARFRATVLALALPLVVAMEAADACLAGRATGDLADLFGGSLALGIGTTAAVALCAASLAIVALRCFCGTRALLVRAVRGLFVRRPRPALAAHDARGRRRSLAFVRVNRRRDAVKRGPPRLVLA